MGVMRDWRQAGLVLAATAVLIGGPVVISANVPTKQTPVGAERIEVTAPGDSPDTVGFTGVNGWSRRPTGDQTTALLDAPDGSVLLVTVANGVTDLPAALEWRRKVLGLQAFDAVFDGGEIGNPAGFHGLTCRAATASGVCAVIGKDNLVVSIALAGGGARLPELLPIVQSVQVAS